MKSKTYSLILVVTLISFGGLEVVSRCVLGLGSPPLYVEDGQLEYLMKPNQMVHRFGNLVQVNERGMRSPSLRNEKRKLVVVVGDSVLNGGAQTSHENLATTQLSDNDTLFVNLSAGSWGPANQMAALQANNDLAITGVVAVLNSEDLKDVPTFEPLDSRTHPVSGPLLATEELLFRYLPRYLPSLTGASEAQADDNAGDEPSEILEAGREKLDSFLRYLAARPYPTCVILHPTRADLRDAGEAYSEMVERIQKANVPMVSLRDLINSSVANVDTLYRDDIHLNSTGQRMLTKGIRSCISQSADN